MNQDLEHLAKQTLADIGLKELSASVSNGCLAVAGEVRTFYAWQRAFSQMDKLARNSGKALCLVNLSVAATEEQEEFPD